MKALSRRELSWGVRLLREHRALAAAFLGASLAQAGARASALWLVNEFLQRVMSGGGGPRGLYIAAAAILAAWLTATTAEYFAKVLQQRLMRGIEFSAMMRVVSHLLTLSVRFFERASHGDLMATARGDIVALRDLTSSACTVLVSSLTCAALAYTAFTLSPKLMLAGLFLVPLSAWPIVMLGRRVRRFAERRRRTGYKIYDVLTQVFSGIRLIKVYQAEKAEVESCRELGKTYYGHLLEGMKSRTLAGVILEALAGLGLVLVILVGGFDVIAGKLAWPALLTFLMVLMSLHEPLRQLVNAQAMFKDLAPSLTRMHALLETKPEIADPVSPRPLTSAPEWLTFENVSFAYDKRPVLHNIDLAIRRGETIGIVGPSGSGKSTLINLAVRFFDPKKGRVTFDGIDLRDMRMDDVLRQFSIVTQDPFLFSGTVRDNIRYGRPDASDADVIHAAEMANIHADILSLEHGYDTRVGIGGVQMSGGQRQRVNVARALLKNAPILLLDEATSALDSVSEVAVQQAIERLMRGRTSLVVAHRLSTLRHAHRLVVLRDGRIEAIGTHEELLQTSATYKKLWETQWAAHERSESRPVPRLAIG